MNKQRIKTMLDSPAGRDLKDFLTTNADELNSLSMLKDLDDPTALAVEVKVNPVPCSS